MFGAKIGILFLFFLKSLGMGQISSYCPILRLFGENRLISMWNLDRGVNDRGSEKFLESTYIIDIV